MEKIVVITGPTGVGKSELAIRLAQFWKGEIINCDASQIRKRLNVGTAKIDWQNSPVPHHLFDFLEPDELFSIKDYQAMARAKIAELTQAGKTVFLVGGSGLYIASVIGDYPMDAKSRDPGFGDRFQSFTNQELHFELAKIDLKSSQTIHFNNRRRVLRALEVAMQGKSLSVSEEPIPRYRTLNLCLVCERSLLYERINHRVEIMFENGWVDEVAALVKSEVKVSSLQEIGYKEIAGLLLGETDLEFVKTLIKQKTRNYAKRQMTWFKHKLDCRFVTMNYQDLDKTYQETNQLISDFLEMNRRNRETA